MVCQEWVVNGSLDHNNWDTNQFVHFYTSCHFGTTQYHKVIYNIGKCEQKGPSEVVTRIFPVCCMHMQNLFNCLPGGVHLPATSCRQIHEAVPLWQFTWWMDQVVVIVRPTCAMSHLDSDNRLTMRKLHDNIIKLLLLVSHWFTYRSVFNYSWLGLLVYNLNHVPGMGEKLMSTGCIMLFD